MASIKEEGIWGDWGRKEVCRGNGIAIGFSLKVEPKQGGGDDTALNGICLHCSGGEKICSKQGPWGDEHRIDGRPCQTGFTDFQLQFERKQGRGDDTAANNLILRCKNGFWKYQTRYSWGNWGRWSHARSCPLGTVICGLRTRVERPQGGGDDTALNGVEFFCCN